MNLLNFASNVIEDNSTVRVICRLLTRLEETGLFKQFTQFVRTHDTYTWFVKPH